MNPMDEINKKLDMILEKLGIQADVPDQETYMKASNEMKDKMDEQQILGRT